MKEGAQKYCHFYIVRHGETVWNLKKIIQGHKDSPLTSQGINQAKRLIKEFNGISFADIFSSDLTRAKETANIVAESYGIEVKTSQLLRERTFGEYDGKKSNVYKKDLRKVLRIKEQLNKEEKFFYKVKEDIESDDEVVRRIIMFINQISNKYHDKNILVVTHSGIIKAFLKHMGYEIRATSHIAIGNTNYLQLDSDGKEIIVKKVVGIQL